MRTPRVRVTRWARPGVERPETENSGSGGTLSASGPSCQRAPDLRVTRQSQSRRSREAAAETAVDGGLTSRVRGCPSASADSAAFRCHPLRSSPPRSAMPPLDHRRFDSASRGKSDSIRPRRSGELTTGAALGHSLRHRAFRRPVLVFTPGVDGDRKAALDRPAMAAR